MAVFAFNKGMVGLLNDIDVGSDTFKALLLKSSYTPDRTDQYVSDLVASECDATGYVGGHAGADRLAVTLSLLEDDPTANDVTIDCADLTWLAIGGAANNTIGGFAIYKENANDGTSELVIWAGLSSNQTTDGNNFPIVVDDGGLLTFTLDA